MQRVRIAFSSVMSGVSVSQFIKTGKITREEFKASGDYLVACFPTWAWDSDAKNYLIMRNAPCLKVSEATDGDFEMTETSDGWITADAGDDKDAGQDSGDAEGKDSGSSEDQGQAAPATAEDDDADDDDDDDDEDFDDAPSLESFTYSADSSSAPASAAAAEDEEDSDALASSTMKTRTYDVLIVYDAYYSTPRVFLKGSSPDGKPLGPKEWQQDFSSDHVGQTVTFEKFPYDDFSCPSIHPCKHAQAMQSMIAMSVGTGRTFDVKYYLLIFIKFIQSIVPNIEYDYTGEFQIEHESA